MQTAITGNDSEFCACEKETIFKVIPFGENEETAPTTCETCHKPNRDPFRFTFKFGGDVEVILPTTNYSREEFEEWQNEHVISKHRTYEEYLAEKDAR